MIKSHSSSPIWVTGAHGFIGRYLCRELARQGSAVCGLGHGAWPASEASQWGVRHWLNGDLTVANLSILRERTGAPATVFHLAGGSSVGAAITQPKEDFSRTVASTVELLEWLRMHAPETELVAVSSAAVYGAGHAGPIDEAAVVSPHSPYGFHKLMMEQLCRSYAANFGVRVVLPRLFSVHGPGLKKQLLWDLCEKMAASGKVELGGSGGELRDWIDVRDVARCLVHVSGLASVEAPVINIASGTGRAVREIAAMVVEQWAAAGSRPPEVIFSGQTRPGDPFCLVADVGRLRRGGLGEFAPVATGVAEYVAWYRKQAEAAF